MDTLVKDIPELAVDLAEEIEEPKVEVDEGSAETGEVEIMDTELAFLPGDDSTNEVNQVEEGLPEAELVETQIDAVLENAYEEQEIEEKLEPEREIEVKNKTLRVSISNLEELVDDERVIYMALLNHDEKRYKVLNNDFIFNEETLRDSFVLPLSFFKEQLEFVLGEDWDLVISTTHNKRLGPIWDRVEGSGYFYPLDGWLEPIKNSKKTYTVLKAEDIKNCVVHENCESFISKESFTAKGYGRFEAIDFSANLIHESTEEESRLNNCWVSAGQLDCFKFEGSL